MGHEAKRRVLKTAGQGSFGCCRGLEPRFGAARAVKISTGLGQPSAELLRECNDDAFGAADVAEPIAALVLRHVADQFGAIAAQTV
jgi:hypothetical protein